MCGRRHAVCESEFECIDVLAGGKMRPGRIVQIDHGARRQSVRLHERRRAGRVAQELCGDTGSFAGPREIAPMVPVDGEIRVDPYCKRREAIATGRLFHQHSSIVRTALQIRAVTA